MCVAKMGAADPAPARAAGQGRGGCHAAGQKGGGAARTVMSTLQWDLLAALVNLACGPARNCGIGVEARTR